MTENAKSMRYTIKGDTRLTLLIYIIPARCVALKQPHSLMASFQSYNAYFWAVWPLSLPNFGYELVPRPQKAERQ